MVAFRKTGDVAFDLLLLSPEALKLTRLISTVTLSSLASKYPDSSYIVMLDWEPRLPN